MKYILITGVSTGIGYECTRDLIKLGYHVLGSVRQKEDAERLKREFGSAFTPLLFDITNGTQIQSAVPVVQGKVGPAGLYALVNNAGVAVAGPLSTLSLDELRYQFEVNLFGQLKVIQSFLILLGAEKNSSYPPGRIINISSTSGGKTYPFMGPYSSSKHALEAVSTALRREMMLYGIKVIVVRPASTWTPIWQKVTDLAGFRDSDYYPFLKRMRDYMVNAARQDMMPVSKVSRIIVRAITTRNPRTHYVVAASKFRDWILPRILPDHVLDRIIAKKLGMNRIT